MVKTVAGIVRGEWSYNERQYYLEALNFYDEVMYIDPLRVTYRLDREMRSVQVDHGGSSLNDLSMLYTFGYKTETLLLVKSLALGGCPSSDPYHLISRDNLGKLNDMLGLLDSGIGTSACILPSLDAAIRYIEALDAGSYPLLRKPIAGNKGRGIKKIENREEALKVCAAHFRRNDSVLLLEKFMDYRNEYRVYVVDGTPVEAYEKVKKEGSVVSNLHQGGTVVAVESELKQRLFARISACVADRFGTGIYGFDLAVTGTGDTHIIEVNRTPGFNGLNRLGLLNLPRHAHEVISKRARRPDAVEPDAYADHVITVLGDTNPGDSYQERRKNVGRGNILAEKGYEYSFQRFRDLLACSDYTLANLEVSVTEQRDSQLSGQKPYIDRASVDGTTKLLKALGINAVSLANNHTKDFDATGLADTVGAMKASDIGCFGAGQTATEANSVVHHHVSIGNRALHIIFAGGFEYRKPYSEWNYYADAENSGVNLWSKANAGGQISALRQQYADAYIVAFPHWGSNYNYVTERQKSLARVLCDSGADLVIGHGSHMLQEITRYKGKWVIYGLGNFVYNSPGRYATYDVLPFGLIGRLNLRADRGAVTGSLNLYPIRSDNKTTDYQPDFISEAEFEQVIKFYMPTKTESEGIQSLVKSGKDKWGYYLSLAGVVPNRTTPPV